MTRICRALCYGCFLRARGLLRNFISHWFVVTIWRLIGEHGFVPLGLRGFEKDLKRILNFVPIAIGIGLADAFLLAADETDNDDLH